MIVFIGIAIAGAGAITHNGYAIIYGALFILFSCLIFDIYNEQNPQVGPQKNEHVKRFYLFQDEKNKMIAKCIDMIVSSKIKDVDLGEVITFAERAARLHLVIEDMKQ